MREKSPLEITSSHKVLPAASLTPLYYWLGKEKSELWIPTWLMPYPRQLLNCSCLFSLPQLLPPSHSLQAVYFSCRQLAHMLQSLQNLTQKRSRSHVTLVERQSLSSKGKIFVREDRESHHNWQGHWCRLTREGTYGRVAVSRSHRKMRRKVFFLSQSTGQMTLVATTPRGCSQRFLSLHSLALRHI